MLWYLARKLLVVEDLPVSVARRRCSSIAFVWKVQKFETQDFLEAGFSQRLFERGVRGLRATYEHIKI